MTEDELAAIRRADYERYKALMDQFIDTIIEGPPSGEARGPESTTPALGAPHDPTA